MDRKVKQLKKLAAKICPEGTEIHGDTVSEVLACINAHYVAPDVPTKTSELDNDAGFITAEDIPDIPSIPNAPTEPGDYKLVVTAEGASWAALE